MSRQAIAAVLARTDLASGERLVALSLASFAGRENRAWPGAPAASARAGLSRSRYQQAREQLVARGLVAVDERVTGRGRASTVTLLFADAGPWWDGDINVELFEAVLSIQPGARARAAAPGDDGGAGGRARRRARPVDGAAVRRGGHCRPDLPARAHRAARVGPTRAGQRCRRPREHERMDRARPARGGDALAAANATAGRAAGRRAAAGGLGEFTALRRSRRRRPTKRAVTIGQFRREKCPILTGVSGPKGGHDRTVSPEKCPVLTGVSGPKGGQDQTLFELAPLETPAENPGKNPGSQRARGEGTPEPQNQRRPPQPP